MDEGKVSPRELERPKSHQSLERLPTSQDAERNLEQNYRRPFAIFAANQALVAETIAAVPTTSLVEFAEGKGGTAERVAAMIKEQQEQDRPPGRISISESWTDEALRYLRRERFADEPGVKLAAMNYANCSYPGGNYSDGGMVRAQEEELCRQFPALFESMASCTAVGSHQGSRIVSYNRHVFGARIGEGYRVARNVLFTEEAQCMRGSAELSYRLLRCKENKVKAGFVEAAAPIFGRGHDHDFEEWRTRPEEWYEKVFLNVFWAPKSNDPKYDVIIVGPWGCGAFGNDPQTVAESFLNVIQTHDLLHLYREIHFCMGRTLQSDQTVGGACNRNVMEFRKVLSRLGDKVEVLDYTADLQEKAVQWLADERRPLPELAQFAPPAAESAVLGEQAQEEGFQEITELAEDRVGKQAELDEVVPQSGARTEVL